MGAKLKVSKFFQIKLIEMLKSCVGQVAYQEYCREYHKQCCEHYVPASEITHTFGQKLLRIWLWSIGKTYDRGEPAVSYRWTGWVWEITSWSSRVPSRVQENYQSFWRNLWNIPQFNEGTPEYVSRYRLDLQTLKISTGYAQTSPRSLGKTDVFTYEENFQTLDN